eukprot:s4340_g4.t1
MAFLAEKSVLSLPSGPVGMTPLTPAAPRMQLGPDLAIQPEPSLFDVHCSKLFCKLPKIQWDARLDSQRNAALAKWYRIVTSEPLAFEVCRAYFNSVKSGLHLGKLQDDLKNVFSSKSTSTLLGRAGPLMRFMLYCQNMQLKAFPLSEDVVYAFMLGEEEKAAPTFFRSFLSSLGFAWHVIGLSGGDLVTRSKQIKGHADKCYLTKKKTRSRLPLRFDELATLEEIVLGRKNRAIPDRHAAGCLLFMTYARARFSDMMNVGSLQFDVSGTGAEPRGFIEAEVARSKTSFSVDRKVRLLPMTVSMNGVLPVCWGLAWKEVLTQSGVTVGSGKPLLPGRTPDGWHTLPLTAEAATNWLRNLLQSGDFFDEKRLDSVGTHTCKSTCLSWLAKWGSSTDMRRLMGYHVADKMSTMLIYGKDNTSAGLREINRILDAIKSGDFVPDANRASMFPNRDDVQQILQQQDVDEFDGQCSQSSEDSADEDQPDHEALEKAVDVVFGRWDGSVDIDRLPCKAVYFRHPVSRTIHMLEDESGLGGMSTRTTFLFRPGLKPCCRFASSVSASSERFRADTFPCPIYEEKFC